jgi:cell division protein FtsB
MLGRLALAAVAGYYALWGGEYSVFDLRHLNDRLAAEQLAIQQVRAEVDSLRVYAHQVERDPATIERLARDRFGMIRPGETLVRFVQPDAPVVGGP